MQQDLRIAFDAAIANVTDVARKAGLIAQFDAADEAADTTKMAAILASASQERHWTSIWWSLGTLALIYVAVAAFVWGIGSYFRALPQEQWTEIASVRPVLVLSLIMSMLAFGGLLISRPLFMPGTHEDIAKKFQLSREIFLVFSGVFATVIGFYFGSSATQNARPAAPFAAVSTIGENGDINLAVSGSDGPYEIEWDGNPGAVSKNGELFVIAFKATLPCPESVQLNVTSRADEASTYAVTNAKADLAAKNWTQCAASPTPADNAAASDS